MQKTPLSDLKSLTRNEMKHITGGVMDYDLSLELTNGGYHFREVYPYIGPNGDCTWMVDTLWDNGLYTSIPANGYGSCNNVC